MNYCMNINMILDILQMFQDIGELSINYDLFAVHYDGDCNKINEPNPIFSWEYALPNTKCVKKSKILCK